MAGKKWDSSLYQDKHSYVWKYGEELLTLLDLQKDESILDVGCGTGELTAQIWKKTGQATGIDSSPDMIEKAKQTFPSEKFPGLKFEVQSATSLKFDKHFDKVFSNAALHWVTDAEAGVKSIRQSINAGGLFVMEMGGNGNVQIILEALRWCLAKYKIEYKVVEKFFFPSISQYTTLLEKSAFDVKEARLFNRMTKLDDGEKGLRNWIQQFASDDLSKLSNEQIEDILSAVEDRCRKHLYFDDCWHADYRRLRIITEAVW